MLGKWNHRIEPISPCGTLPSNFVQAGLPSIVKEIAPLVSGIRPS